MGADTLQVWTEVVADIADLVTGLAGGHEEFLAFEDVARLLHVGAKLGYQIILGWAAAGVEFDHDGDGALGDRLIWMADQLGDLHGAELHGRKRLRFKCVKHQSSPLGSSDECREQGGPERSGRLREGTVECLTDGSIASGGKGASRSHGDSFPRTGQSLGESRTHLRVNIAQQHEDTHGVDLGFDRGLSVSEDRQEAASGRGEFGLQVTIREPQGGEGGGGACNRIVLTIEQAAQGIPGAVEIGRGGHAAGNKFTKHG